MAHERGYTVKIVSGQHMHQFAKSVKYKLKTDKIDAKIIARYGIERGDDEPNWTPPSAHFRNIKRLSRERITRKILQDKETDWRLCKRLRMLIQK